MNDRAAELIGAIERGLKGLERVYQALVSALATDIKTLGKSGNSALIVAGLLENYYTCVETMFLRISQVFENHLSAERWHTDLLERMTMEVPGVRAAVISEDNFSALLEILKFRHFKRYYFEIEYDWDRLDFLIKKLTVVHSPLVSDLQTFMERLRQV